MQHSRPADRPHLHVGGWGRTLDQKRVDALAEILAENVCLDISVDVVIPADTLAGLQNCGASIRWRFPPNQPIVGV